MASTRVWVQHIIDKKLSTKKNNIKGTNHYLIWNLTKNSQKHSEGDHQVEGKQTTVWTKRTHERKYTVAYVLNNRIVYLQFPKKLHQYEKYERPSK